ncbi:hypothetical protein BVRB_7g166140 [Beta vulgaris subsp. vulgaris]|nr:hypothetical protein BVRB_7g166140 [Beta vulgaris subsp. vulgaris]
MVEVVAEKRGQLEYWGESGVAMADTSQHTDTFTDVDTDDRDQCFLILISFQPVFRRVALATAANMVKKLPFDAADFVMEAVPHLLQYHDAKVLEHASVCLTRILRPLHHLLRNLMTFAIMVLLPRLLHLFQPVILVGVRPL